MRFFKGKLYENNLLSLLSAVLYNFKWIGVAVAVLYALPFLEAATDSGGISSDEEYLMYTFWISFIAAVLLFKYKSKWESFCDSITDTLNKRDKR